MAALGGLRRGWVIGGLASFGAIAGFVALALCARPAPQSAPTPATAGSAGASSTTVAAPDSLRSLAKGLASGDGMSLAILQKRAVLEPGQSIAPIAETESEDWLSAITSLRDGYGRYSPYGRSSAVNVAASILEKFAVEPSPPGWASALTPCFEIMSAAMDDTDATVRQSALARVAGLWRLSPIRDLHTAEIEHLAAWKESLYQIALRSMGDTDVNSRAAAVAAVASLPLNDKAQPALAYLKDPSPQVRIQVLGGFARRSDMLDSEAILPFLYDPDATIARYAAQVLKNRGLTMAQIDLGRHVVHPMPRMRAAAVSLIQSQTDIDPTLWLVFLSRDSDPSVRSKAAEALASSSAPEAIQRLGEMAASDPSPEVREVAAKASPAAAETTALLPPLPGSPRLNPKAN